MSAQLIRKLVVVCVFVLFQCLCQINGQQYVGDQCTVARTGAIGTCKLIDECPAVITEIIQNHLYPTSCGFVGRKQIVCCPRPATKPPITTKPPHIVNRISAKSMSFINVILMLSNLLNLIAQILTFILLRFSFLCVDTNI